MATFPLLKTAAVAQYPAERAVAFQNQTLRFVDGSEQRYRDSKKPLHRWWIRLDQLDESEQGAVEQFFAANQGAYASFAFTDPWDGHVYQDCSVESDVLYLTALDQMWGRTVVTIRENRG